MTITQLEYILAVDAHRNFAEAAKICFITQPTLSMQIKKLEEELGVLIFDRSKKPVIPTEVGQRIIQQAREGLHTLNRIPELVREEISELHGLLRVGIIPTLSPYLLPRFATRFAARYPSVQLEFEELLSEQILRELSQDRLDIGLLATPLKQAGILEQPLFYEAFYLYMSPNYPLEGRDEIGQEDLDLKDMWTLREGHCFRDQTLNICTSDMLMKESGRNIKVQSGSLDTLRRIVDQQYGFTLLPELAVLQLSPSQQRNVRPFRAPQPLREISMLTHRSYLKQRLVKAFQDEVMASVPHHMLSSERGEVVQWKRPE